MKKELETLEDIRNMMERSSRFISLSGWSGVSAGICACIGAWFANRALTQSTYSLAHELIIIGLFTFAAAFIFTFFFTYFRSKKDQTPIWGYTARNLLINMAVPMLAGGTLIVFIALRGYIDLIAPTMLIIYGISLFCASKFTVPEIRYMAYLEMLLGMACLYFIDYGLYFWTAGFGLLHIFYGVAMWMRYERKNN